jgi:hypothetical protein
MDFFQEVSQPVAKTQKTSRNTICGFHGIMAAFVESAFMYHKMLSNTCGFRIFSKIKIRDVLVEAL